MLLNEYQKQHRDLAQQRTHAEVQGVEIARLKAALEAKDAEIAGLDARLDALEQADAGPITMWPLVLGGLVLVGVVVGRRGFRLRSR